MPGNQWQALSMANALLIADGLLSPDQVRWPALAGLLACMRLPGLNSGRAQPHPSTASPHLTPPTHPQVMWPDPPVEWASMTVAELRAELVARKLNAKGLKEDLIERLREWDANLAREAAEHTSQEVRPGAVQWPAEAGWGVAGKGGEGGRPPLLRGRSASSRVPLRVLPLYLPPRRRRR